MAIQYKALPQFTMGIDDRSVTGVFACMATLTTATAGHRRAIEATPDCLGIYGQRAQARYVPVAAP